MENLRSLQIAFFKYLSLIYWTLCIRPLAFLILLAIIANSARYEYIAQIAENDKSSNEDLTNKNINKAFKIAEQFCFFPISEKFWKKLTNTFLVTKEKDWD